MIFQVLQEDDSVRQFVVLAGAVKHSYLFDTASERGVELLLVVFAALPI